MLLDLRQQDIFKRRAPRHAILARPAALQDFIIAIGEKCLCIAIQHRLQKVKRAKSVIQEDTPPRLESRRFRGKLIEANEIRRIDRAVLE